MPLVTGHRPGWPCWVELATPDRSASERFYSGLFGWDSYTLLVPHRGEVEVFTLDGADGEEVAGLEPLADPAQPASWTCYFRTADMAATTTALHRAGGSELIEAADLGNLGRAALWGDPQGADFAVIDTYDFIGARVVDEPSAPCWIQLATSDVAGARRFYGEVFGWRPVDREYFGIAYTEFKVDEQSVAGMMALEGPVSRPEWMPFFEVADCDAAADRAAKLGAEVSVPPTGTRPGRFAILTDPTGAQLGVITPDPETRAGFRLRS